MVATHQKKLKAAFYIRVSTHHQIDKDSLPFQRQELENYAKFVLGIEDYVIFEDAGYSGGDTKRPAYQEMMKRIREGEFTHLLVWKIDRISRNIRDFSDMYDELKKHNIIFVSKVEQFDTSTAMGEAMLKIILVFAELERNLAKERVKSIMLSRAEKGLWNGATVPLGYVWCDKTKFPVVDKKEAEVVQYIYDLYEKLSSTIKVAHRLNNENVPTKRGGRWTEKTVRDILRNEFYIGTYIYNQKDKNRRYKDKSEWIIVENNHEGIVTEEQFRKVNKMLSDNYRGVGNVQRRNIHTHMFAKLLYCGKCGELLTSGLDVARKDGYRPSRYTCSTNKKVENIHSCNSFVSDVTTAPFMLNYIANLIRLQDKITPKHSFKDIERMLVRGKPFVDVLGLDKNSLKATYDMFVKGYNSQKFKTKKEDVVIESHTLEVERLKKQRQKEETALKRLMDLYLYQDEVEMSEKDYILKKKEIEEKIEKLDQQLKQYINQETKTHNIPFINNAKHLAIKLEIYENYNIDYRDLLDAVGVDLIADFIHSVVDKVIIRDKQIESIIFKNGMTHTFIYKPEEKRKARPPQRLLYRKYEDVVVEYIKENGSAQRKDIEEITGLKRWGATNLVNELLERNIIERKGNSIAIRYFLKENTPNSSISPSASNP